MAQADNAELVDAFEQFFRDYYDNEIKQLAQRYPNEQRSLRVDWQDLYRFDPDLADDFLNQPEQLQRYAEEALRLYDLPIDVSLGQAHVRLRNLPETETPEIREIRARDMNSLVQVHGIVRKATDVRPKIEEAAFECQLCGTLTRVPQSSGDFQEPHECQGCERQGPFRVNFDQSEFVDSQKLRIQESPEGLRGGETPQALDIHVEDDITGEVTPGDHVSATGVLRLEQQGDGQDKSPVFDFYMEGMSVDIDEEQFEDMDITEEDKKRIYEISNQDDVYERMVASIAPSIYGYEEEKLAMILQLFSGVTKQLPDGSRIRGDLHMLLIGDPGTGKSQMLGYIQNIAPRSVYTSGKGSSSAGLTAAAVRDDFGDGQQWTLEAGALVLADQGIAAVDELDKMRCVTGETVVQTQNGNRQIWDIARDAVADGSVEELENGRTIRDVDLSVRTMTNAGTIVTRPVTAVHQYEAPSELVEITTEDGQKLRSTSDHPFFVSQNGSIAERSAGDLEVGDRTLAPSDRPSVAADGGVVTVEQPSDSSRRDVEPTEIVEVRRIDGDGREYVYDLTVEGTHNFIANGMIVHNSEDRSAMHEALEQQKISVSKAGINATLKSRCSLLGAANPKYGRFDHYEPISEQIDLEPALISRFDLIFTVTDEPDEEKDKNLAEHIITTNYAGELTTQREEMSSLEVSAEEIAEMTDQVDPEIDAELLRKYIAYAKQNCHPRMTEEAREAIRDFYVDLRSKGTDEDAAVPVTARKLEALVRLSEASARVRLSDTVDRSDAEQVIEIVRSCLQDIGVDPETGEFDADIVEAGTSKSQRDRIKNIKGLIADIEEEYDDGAPVDIVLDRAEEIGMDHSKAEHEIEKLKQKGEVYEPSTDSLRTT
ncbi:AAA family ATPase [Salinadaptatus halalkaliphilus]|uniref:DNA helicase n=1 Tax=Salinadaptatus halalkaliphilus TaxID=2419781 RepID=A0A4S3TMP1_9EURY|nr:AAA family ATPase [Salinadaptatus halalkaliphilus]THE65492.1 AAA family ATPase [Salinadaptatus halalkaliphilus]